jgi:hypothetical protein
VFLHLARDGEKNQGKLCRSANTKKAVGSNIYSSKNFLGLAFGIFHVSRNGGGDMARKRKRWGKKWGKLARHVLQSVGDI